MMRDLGRRFFFLPWVDIYGREIYDLVENKEQHPLGNLVEV